MKANKNLGQHFLRDVGVLADIAAVTDLTNSSGALEIGPGEGALTAFLVKDGAKTDLPIHAIDPDPRAIEAITERFSGRVTTFFGDATKIDFNEILPPPKNGRLPVIVGNLPYNVGSIIQRRILDLGCTYARAVLMFQKEVALRYVAKPKTSDYGIPSIMTQVACKAWLVREVGPECFAPRPKVDSAVILMEPRAEPLIPTEHLEAFGNLLGRAFQQRRKTLNNTLGEYKVQLEALGVSMTARAEELSVETWVALFQAIQAAKAE